jgi:putative effector of murein hydrolase
MDTDSILALITSPSAILCVTIGSYIFAIWLQKTCNNHSLLSPVVIAIALVVAYIALTGVPYEEYLNGANLIHGLLAPATVALAVPLYKQLPLIRKQAAALGATTLICSILAAGSAYALAELTGAADDLKLSILSKSTTTPIAISIAESISASPSLAVLFVFATGIIGIIIAPVIFKALKIESDEAKGFALGLTCHALGIARAFQYSATAGAYAALGLSLMGIISGIILPALYVLFLK